MKLFYIYFVYIPIFSLFSLIWSYSSDDLNKETLLSDHIYRLSESEYTKKWKTENGKEGTCIADGQLYDNWKSIIEKAFRKLIDNSGKHQIPICYVVLEENSFNAAAFPNGKFLINVGTLKILDARIKSEKLKDIDKARESYIAAILSHELAHYYNRHTIKFMKRLLDSGNKKNIELQKIQFSQEDELDADSSGMLYMERAGYDNWYFKDMLKIINQNYQNSLEKARNDKKEHVSIYFSTHPSPHLRLSNAGAENAEFHRTAFLLEKLFADIQLGRNLDSIKSSLDKLLIDPKYRDNPEILRAYAVCLHKIWLESVSLEDQSLRGVLDMPSFRDSMLFKKAVSGKGRKEIPGDKAKYWKARRAYLKLLKNIIDLEFCSNYALLLAYSDKPHDWKEAVIFAEKSNEILNTTISMNNLGVVYYITEMKKVEEVIPFFEGIVKRVEPALKAKVFSKQIEPEKVKAWEQIFKNRQAYDSNYVFEDFTPILNLALLYHYSGKTDLAKEIAKTYLKDYDSESDWSKFLSKTTNVKLPEISTGVNQLSVSGLKIGNSLVDAVRLLGKPDDKIVGYEGDIWVYQDKKTKIIFQEGKVREIRLEDSSSPPVNQELRVGAEKSLAEKVLGKNSQKKGQNKFIYFQKGKASISYSNNIVNKIILFE
ncbi:MAG: M48 family metalloprotease [Leptospiraceae bacterium]|nr:M48 family metalloprotease [Leptospiraceae bacterium]MCP5500166.1 M48 family metalloprotease [Leptospiraceae bacterium]